MSYISGYFWRFRTSTWLEERGACLDFPTVVTPLLQVSEDALCCGSPPILQSYLVTPWSTDTVNNTRYHCYAFLYATLRTVEHQHCKNSRSQFYVFLYATLWNIFGSFWAKICVMIGWILFIPELHNRYIMLPVMMIHKQDVKLSFVNTSIWKNQTKSVVRSTQNVIWRTSCQRKNSI